MTESERIRLRKIADTQYEIFPLLKQRYSPRVFQKSPLQADHINKLFEAARWASSAGNCQPWRFVYAGSGSAAYEKILACMIENDRVWAGKAPLLMLSVYKESIDSGKENFHALHDLGQCLGNMAVQAQYMGVGMHQISGIDRVKAAKDFQIPKGFQTVSAIALGYYGGETDILSDDHRKAEHQERNRAPQKDFAYPDSWTTGNSD